MLYSPFNCFIEQRHFQKQFPSRLINRDVHHIYSSRQNKLLRWYQASYILLFCKIPCKLLGCISTWCSRTVIAFSFYLFQIISGTRPRLPNAFSPLVLKMFTTNFNANINLSFHVLCSCLSVTF